IIRLVGLRVFGKGPSGLLPGSHVRATLLERERARFSFSEDCSPCRKMAGSVSQPSLKRRQHLGETNESCGRERRTAPCQRDLHIAVNASSARSILLTTGGGVCGSTPCRKEGTSMSNLRRYALTAALATMLLGVGAYGQGNLRGFK